MKDFRREFTEQIRKEKIEDLVISRRLKLLQQSEGTIHVPRDQQYLGELPHTILFKENPLLYFKQIGVLLEQLVEGRTHPGNIIEVLKHTRDESISSKFPVQSFIDSKLADYLFQLIQKVNGT